MADEKMVLFHKYLTLCHKVVPVGSVHRRPSFDIGFSVLAPASQVSLFEHAIYSRTINHLLEWSNFGKNHASEFKLGQYGGTWYSEIPGHEYVPEDEAAGEPSNHPFTERGFITETEHKQL